jgi:membrane protein implicated in regulation of membrane protease activity
LDAEPQNPWIGGLLAVSVLLLLPLGVLTIIGLLIAMAIGVDLANGPDISAQAAGIFLLAVIAVLGFVMTMSARWDRRHGEGVGQ